MAIFQHLFQFQPRYLEVIVIDVASGFRFLMYNLSLSCSSLQHKEKHICKPEPNVSGCLGT